MLVLIVIFAQFRVPPAAQRKALVAGVLGAVVLRTALVVGGASLIEQVHAVTYLLGAVLVATAVKLALSGDAKEQEAGEPRPGLVERIARRILPVSRELDGTRLFTRETVQIAGEAGAGGRTRLAWRATPLLIVVLVIEVTDLVFALDSVPAVLGVTSDPVIALTSNLFAVLGLRSLFFLVSGLLARLRYLQTGLVLILLFIGTKMLASFAIEIPVAASLLVITTILGGAVRSPRSATSSIPTASRSTSSAPSSGATRTSPPSASARCSSRTSRAAAPTSPACSPTPSTATSSASAPATRSSRARPSSS